VNARAFQLSTERLIEKDVGAIIKLELDGIEPPETWIPLIELKVLFVFHTVMTSVIPIHASSRAVTLRRFPSCHSTQIPGQDQTILL